MNDESGPKIESISAVTLAVIDIARSVAFYRRIGFELRSGGEHSSFASFGAGSGFLNLALSTNDAGLRGRWGRVIFYVSDVDAMYERVIGLGLAPDFPPRDAPWGERYFHLSDPDGHELSFACPLAVRRN
jgi:catechol 2,3-dioxygenase-like lactoylglutathione lyase family enzyme